MMDYIRFIFDFYWNFVNYSQVQVFVDKIIDLVEVILSSLITVSMPCHSPEKFFMKKLFSQKDLPAKLTLLFWKPAAVISRCASF